MIQNETNIAKQKANENFHDSVFPVDTKSDVSPLQLLCICA